MEPLIHFDKCLVFFLVIANFVKSIIFGILVSGILVTVEVDLDAPGLVVHDTKAPICVVLNEDVFVSRKIGSKIMINFYLVLDLCVPQKISRNIGNMLSVSRGDLKTMLTGP